MENIVYVATARDWFDYLATGATLLLSVIAVIIAVSTAKRQNKISLFTKREEVIDYVFELLMTWEVLANIIANQSDELSIKKACEYAAFSRLKKANAQFDAKEIPTNILLEEVRKLEYLDMMYLKRTQRLFSLKDDQFCIVYNLIDYYQKLMDEIIMVLQNQIDLKKVKTLASSFYELSKKETKALAVSLEKQMNIHF